MRLLQPGAHRQHRLMPGADTATNFDSAPPPRLPPGPPVCTAGGFTAPPVVRYSFADPWPESLSLELLAVLYRRLRCPVGLPPDMVLDLAAGGRWAERGRAGPGRAAPGRAGVSGWMGDDSMAGVSPADAEGNLYGVLRTRRRCTALSQRSLLAQGCQPLNPQLTQTNAQPCAHIQLRTRAGWVDVTPCHVRVLDGDRPSQGCPKGVQRQRLCRWRMTTSRPGRSIWHQGA